MLKRNLIANYLGQGLLAVLELALTPLYIKYLGAEAYGLIGIFAMLLTWLGMLDMGMTPMLNREMARFTGGGCTPAAIRELLHSVEAVGLLVATAITFGIFISADWLATAWLQVKNLPTDAVASALSIIGLVVALRLLGGIYRSALVGLQRQVMFNAIHASMALVRGIGSIIVLKYISPTIQYFFFWHGLIAFVTIISLATATYLQIPSTKKFEKPSIRALYTVRRFASGIFLISLSATILNSVDKLILTKILSLADYGHYALATMVANSLSILLIPITQAWSPKLTELREKKNGNHFIVLFHQGSQILTTSVGTVALIIIGFSDIILHIWLQDVKLSHAVSNLTQILMLSSLLGTLCALPGIAQIAHGWTRIRIISNILALLFILPAIFLVVPKYGAYGAAWIFVILNAGYLFIETPFIFKRILPLEIKSWYFKDVLLPLLGASAVIFPARFFFPQHLGQTSQIFFLIGASLLAFIASGMFASHIRNHILLFRHHVSS